MARPRHRRRSFVAIALVLGLLGGIVGLQTLADAATTVSPSEASGSIYPGASLVRDDSITATEDAGGQWNNASQDAVICGLSGRFPATTIVVEGPDGVVAGPATKTWGLLSPNTTLSVPVNLADQPAGLYTVTTTLTNVKRASALSCPATGVTTAVSTTLFEYRPWQHTFKDVLGNGSVKFNITPTAESQAKVGTVSGAVVPGSMSFYTLPGGSAFSLPSDPAGCLADLTACLPATAVACDPSTGCEPRLVVISRSSSAEKLTGVFDLDTGAFIASTSVGRTVRLLLSLGSQGDSIYTGTLAQLAAVAAGAGIDLETILGTQVTVGHGVTETTLSLLNGLQIDPSTAKGIRITSALGVQAGLLVNIYTNLDSAACPAATSGSSAAGDTSYAHGAPTGINVQRSDLLPKVPSAAGLDALGIGGPIWHIEGTYNPNALLNTSLVLAGADAFTPDPALGLPVSVEALLTAPLAARSGMKTMDFLGTASWTASETNLGILGCLSIDLVLGVGVAIFNNPLPLGLGDLPLWDSNPAMAALTAQVDAALSDVTGQVTSLPLVQDLLAQILALVPDVL